MKMAENHRSYAERVSESLEPPCNAELLPADGLFFQTVNPDLHPSVLLNAVTRWEWRWGRSVKSIHAGRCEPVWVGNPLSIY